jgi:hypothetical protein
MLRVLPVGFYIHFCDFLLETLANTRVHVAACTLGLKVLDGMTERVLF